MTTTWNAGELLRTSSAYWRGCTLQAAVRLGIFTVLHNHVLSAGELGDRLEADARGSEYLLNALAAMGLLIKEEGGYRNSDQARNLLSRQSPNYMGHIILHHHHILDGWAQLAEVVKLGHPVTTRSYGKEVERESFLMGMFNLASHIAPRAAKALDLQDRKHLLDLGGGPGTYAIHFCLANPQLQATIFDRPTTAPFAAATVESYGLQERIGFAGGDITQDSIPGGPYDMAWLSHLLHSTGPDQCRKIIAKAVSALQPGGLIMIHEFILNNDKAGPEFPALFSLNMLVNNPTGRAYSEEELRLMLEENGVRDVLRHPFQGPNDSAILYGRI